MSVYPFSATLMNGEDKSFTDYQDKVLLIVNTATKCGFSSQLKGLQSLYETYGEAGFVVLGFPCNQFKNQEPGTNEETEQACQLNYGVTFPLFQKVDVKGEHAHPLYDYIRQEKKGFVTSTIKWNFTKFLINQDGHVIKRYAPTTAPEKIAADVEALLHG